MSLVETFLDVPRTDSMPLAMEPPVARPKSAEAASEEAVLIRHWDARLEAYLFAHMHGDAAHDLGHIRRVVLQARRIAHEEGPHDALVVTAAGWLHDLVFVPKDSPDRSKASVMAADEAAVVLNDMQFPEDRIMAVHHAIAAHSFSANIAPTTLEARAVQDADRLDALGAIGLARCFTVGGTLNRAMFDPQDPLATERPLDDQVWSLDHLPTKLLRLPEMMQTQTGRMLAQTRAGVLSYFLEQIAAEASSQDGQELLSGRPA